ncbi:hypothetical protein DVS28_a3841 [Euzebya pacifica]|uniref:Uncharacterized protein n=1 Tax=Euzebya pacifica TaxID=1608957 RepID=A0A346Y216_9ACTN|nr:hypothetical protein DVS28_a3841 [Euzebya pacifica]
MLEAVGPLHDGVAIELLGKSGLDQATVRTSIFHDEHSEFGSVVHGPERTPGTARCICALRPSEPRAGGVVGT